MPENPTYNEKELLIEISGSDERAFNQLFDRYRLPVYAHVLSIIKSPANAEEITQDIFIKVWNKRAELLSVVSFPDWLFIVTRNSSLSALRKELSRNENLRSESIPSGDDPLRGLIFKETNQFLHKAIQLLPARRRQVFIMSRIELKSHKEIAKEMGITPGTVNLQLVQALAFIRAFLHNLQRTNKNLAGEYIYLAFAASLLI